MACTFEYKGKTYDQDGLVAALKEMSPAEAAPHIPGIKPVPDGPFKDSWHRLALHDQIREAAEKGYDRISWTGGKASPTNPKNLGRSGEEAEKAENGLVKHYDEKLVNAANKIGKAHGVKVEASDVGGYRMVDANGKPGQHFETKAAADEWLAKNPGAAEHWTPKAVDTYHMDIPQSLKDQALKKGFSMFEDSGKAGAALAAAEHSAPHDPFGMGPLDSHPNERALTVKAARPEVKFGSLAGAE